jgi:hypothetical protein
VTNQTEVERREHQICHLPAAPSHIIPLGDWPMLMKTVFYIFTALVGASYISMGQTETDAGLEQSRAPKNLQVIESLEFDYGPRSLIMNRVVPPNLPETSEVPENQAPELNTLPDESFVQVQEGEIEQFFAWGAVYDGHISELTWTRNGRSYRFVSNVNFNEFPAPLGEIKVALKTYSLMIMAGEAGTEAGESRAAAEQWPTVVEQWLAQADQSAETAQYIIVSSLENDAQDGEALQILDDLHQWYDANRTTLQTAYLERKAAQEARQQWEAANPPQPKDTVIHFWPKRSTNYEVSAQ